ncbi:MmyB family transcriptional regulator [Nocardia puris]|nr:helix-turn-helix domain-containing protein [Nocardia puris]
MNRRMNPTRAPRRRHTRADPELPSLGSWVRRAREHRRLTRPRAAELLHVSTDLLKKIERDEIPCSPAVLGNMATAYDLDDAQRRYTHDLSQPPVPLSTVAELRSWTSTPEHGAKLDYLDRRGLIGAYIDPLWNVVLSNQRFRTALPGVERYGDNIALWFFHPGSHARTAESLVLHWDSAAAYLVASLRGALGRHRDTPHARTLYQELRGAATFTRLWDTSLSVAYGVRTEQPVHLRDPTTGQPYAAHIHLGAQGTDLHFGFAYRDPADQPQP